MNTELTFTKDNGEIVSRQYLRVRVSAALSKYRRWYSLAERRAIIADTIDNEKWLSAKNYQTVGSVARAAIDELI